MAYTKELRDIISNVQGQLGNTVESGGRLNLDALPSEGMRNVKIATPADRREFQRKAVHVKRDRNAEYSDKIRKTGSDKTFFGHTISSHSGLTKDNEFVVRVVGPIRVVNPKTGDEQPSTNTWLAEERYMKLVDGKVQENVGLRRRQLIKSLKDRTSAKGESEIAPGGTKDRYGNVTYMNAEDMARDWVNAINENDTAVPPFELVKFAADVDTGELHRDKLKQEGIEVDKSNTLKSGDATFRELSSYDIGKLPACDRFVLTHLDPEEMGGYPIHGKTVDKQKFIAKWKASKYE